MPIVDEEFVDRLLRTFPDFKQTCDSLGEAWRQVLQAHFGERVRIGRFADLPPGQIWRIEAITVVGAETLLPLELLSFTFAGCSYANPQADAEVFEAINETLADELCDLACKSGKLDAIKRTLAEQHSEEQHTHRCDVVIRSFLKTKASSEERSDGLLHLDVNPHDPGKFQVGLIYHRKPPKPCGSDTQRAAQ